MKKNGMSEVKKTAIIITAIIACLGALGGAILWTASILSLPEKVEANEEDIVDLKQIIRDQQIINDFYYKREQQVQQQPYYFPNQQAYPNQAVEEPQYKPPQPYCEWEDEKEWCWDEYYEKWWRRM